MKCVILNLISDDHLAIWYSIPSIPFLLFLHSQLPFLPTVAWCSVELASRLILGHRIRLID
jgi:hypothetical protein